MTLTMTTIAFVVINYYLYDNNKNDISAKLLSTCESRKKDVTPAALDKFRLETLLVMLVMGNFPAFSMLRNTQKYYNATIRI